jgi:hypothetical protein
MSDDIARLGVFFDAHGAEELLKKLKDVENQSDKTEKSTESFTDAIRRNTGAIAASSAAIQRDIQQMLELQKATNGVSNATAQATSRVGALRTAHSQTEKSMRATQHAGLGLSRQLVDIGVSAQMGMNPLTILVQQGPQIADIFQQAAIQGQSFNGILRAMYAQMLPLLPVLLAIGVVVGATATVLGVTAHEINKSNKDIVSSLGLTASQLEKVKNKHVTMADVIKGTWNAASKAFASVFKDEIAAVSKFFSNFYNMLLTGVKRTTVDTLGYFLGSYHAIKNVWGLLPAAIGDIMISTANLAIKGVDFLVNGTIRALNALLKQANAIAEKAGLPGLGQVSEIAFAQIANPWAGAAQNAGQKAADGFLKGWTSRGAVAAGIGDFIQGEIIKAAQDRIRKEAGKPGKSAGGKAGKSEYSDLYHDAKWLEITSEAAGKAMDREQDRVEALIEKNTRLIALYERQVEMDRRRYDILAEQGRGMAGAAVDDVLLKSPDAEIQRKRAAYAEIDRLRQEDILSEKQSADAKRNIDRMIWEEKLARASGFFGQFASLQNSSNRKLAAIGRAAAIAQATIDGVLAVQKALATIPFPFNIAAATAVGAMAAVNVAKIAGVKGFAVGGYTGDGAAGQVAGVTHGREFVVNAAATRRNRSALEAMNSGRAIPLAPNNDNGRQTRVTVVKGDMFDAIVEERARAVAAPMAQQAKEEGAQAGAAMVADSYARRKQRELY